MSSRRWLTPALDALRRSLGHEFITIAERLAVPPAQTVRVLPVIDGDEDASPGKIRPIILPAPGLTWQDVTVTILGRSISLSAGEQSGTHAFRNRSDLGQLHPLGILMRMAKNGQWQNPPRHDSHYERASKAYRRTRQLLRELVAIPGEPFARSDGASIPVFRIALGRALSGRARQPSAKSDDGEGE